MASATPNPVVLLFPGQGAQQSAMGVGLYRAHAGFRDAVDAVFALWGPAGVEIREDWLSDDPSLGIDDTRRSQPLLFALDYALGRVVLDWGLTPHALLGHSVGEVAAAVLAGVLSLPEAASAVADRVRQLADAPPGGMLVVAASRVEVAQHLAAPVCVGAVNASRQVMLAGPEPALTETARRLTAAGLVNRKVRAERPFHSPLLAEAAARCGPAMARVRLRPPRTPLYSGYTGALLDDHHAVDPEFWTGQPARPVLFDDALRAVGGQGRVVFVEAGPGRSLTSLAARVPGHLAVLSMLPLSRRDPEADLDHLTRTRDRLRQLSMGEDIR